ncbi:uncharacterized protein BDCG_07558 [Blastomyces dermatitidis ER-3]|uniref:Uncharacterized protein n=2 Tax=Ajellomyces dermatitidis TaxID=5039 RepID=F2TLB6_AJEDA|nr:uncharacterized protein BDCG_07558 [Blastomyces dermatitidis ER-3]EEQ92438.1 hypothetical protein BDCG_07558 [Blastomyces dermatitidis ER-3]EGE84029.1 hypothetical protein BDDG_06974 [Blastomyces dermatitidis ATCC 18188]
MTTASMEQVGSGLKQWLACLTCIWHQGDEQAHERPAADMGVAREMKLCHDQPHLVPPMKLVFYDDLPGPGRSRSSSISHWVSEGWTLASKATDRVSTGRKSTKRSSHTPTISGPSDFRRLNPPTSRLEPFRPLELSIYQPGNRLSDLPEFDVFDINIPNKFESSGPKPPPKVFSPLDSSSIHSAPVPSFKVPRKPVGSISRRPLSVSDRIEVHDHRPQPPERILDPAPGISADNIKARNNTHARQSRTESEPLNANNSLIIEHEKQPPVTSSSTEMGDLPFPSPPVNTIGMESQIDLISFNGQPKKRSNPRSHKVAQWLFPKPPSSTSDPTSQAAWTPLTSRPRQASQSTIHSRTLSGSTASSANNSSMTACSRRTPSLSSAITATTVHPPPSIPGTLDNEAEATRTTIGFNMSHGNSNKLFASRLEEPCPTVYEADHHHFHHQCHFDENDKFLVTSEHTCPVDFKPDRIGMAF